MRRRRSKEATKEVDLCIRDCRWWWWWWLNGEVGIYFCTIVDPSAPSGLRFECGLYRRRSVSVLHYKGSSWRITRIINHPCQVSYFPIFYRFLFISNYIIVNPLRMYVPTYRWHMEQTLIQQLIWPCVWQSVPVHAPLPLILINICHIIESR